MGNWLLVSQTPVVRMFDDKAIWAHLMHERQPCMSCDTGHSYCCKHIILLPRTSVQVNTPLLPYQMLGPHPVKSNALLRFAVSNFSGAKADYARTCRSEPPVLSKYCKAVC